MREKNNIYINKSGWIFLCVCACEDLCINDIDRKWFDEWTGSIEFSMRIPNKL